MRILKVDIVGFGFYRNRQLSFEDGNQLLYGTNEVGKSTLYQFIQAMLFGFPTRSKKRRDYAPQDGTSYGGRLWFQTEECSEVKIERFRQINSGKPRIWLGENEVSDDHLVTILKGLNQQVFQEIYTFQQDQLSQIDRLQENELQEALLSLGISGSQKLLEVTKQDKKRNQQLFSPQAKVRPLNQKITELESLQKKISLKEGQESQIQEKHRKIQESTQVIRQQNERLVELSKEQEMIHQQESFWDEYEEWQILKRKVADRVTVTKEELTSLQYFYQNYQHYQEGIQKKQNEMSRLEDSSDSSRYLFYLDHEGVIQRLANQQIEMSRAYDREQEWTNRLVKRQAAKKDLEIKWGWSEKNRPATIAPSVFKQIEQLVVLEKECLQKKEQLSILLNRQIELESDINQVEREEAIKKNQHNKRSQTSSPLFFYGGLVLIGSGLCTFFLHQIVGGGLLAVGVLLSLYQQLAKRNEAKKTDTTANKMYWQEKYNQLDRCFAQIQTSQQEIDQLNQTIQSLRGILQPMFGNQTDASKWRDSLEIYEKEAEIYQTLCLDIQQDHLRINEQRMLLETSAADRNLFTKWLPIADLSIIEQIQAILSFGSEMQELKLDRLQQPSTILSRQIQQMQQERDQFLAKNQNLLEKKGIHHPTELSVYLKQWQEQQILETRYRELSNRLTKIYPNTVTYESFLKNKQRVQQNRQQTEEKRNQTSQFKQRLQVELEQMQQDGTLDEWYQRRVQLEDEMRELAIEWSSNELHAKILSDLAGNQTESQLPHLLKEASKYFALLTNNHYERVTLDGGLLTVKNEKESLDIYQLSTGTKDQLIMALRFAFISLNEYISLCPIMIDDGWLHYDHKRKYQLAKVFAEFGKKNQLICLSSDREMVSYYQELRQPIYQLQ